MKILIVLTSHDQLGDTGKKTGFWLEEFAAPYYVLKDAELTLASPKGGQPPLDPKSEVPEFQTELTKRFQTPLHRLNLSTRKASRRVRRRFRRSLHPDMARCGTCPTTRHPSH